MKRKQKTTGNEEINELLWEWFLHACSKNMPISGPILQRQSLELAKKFDKPDFKASNEWLESFRKWHKIVWNQVCGEASDISISLVSKWKDKLKVSLEGLLSCDICNVDETGLFLGHFSQNHSLFVEKNVLVAKCPKNG